MQKLAFFGGAPVRLRPPIIKPRLGSNAKKEVIKAIQRGFLSNFEGTGIVQEFENRFAEFNKAGYAVAVNSGTSALHTALTVIPIQPGDEVLVPAFTFVANASVVIQQGAKPVFVDIDPRTYCMSPTDLQKKITAKAKAVIPVHLYGHPADMERIMKIARENNLQVIEDCAQAHGAKIGSKNVGTFGLAGCYSFSKTKNITTGEGGLIVTNKKIFADECRIVRQNGKKNWKVHERLGYNYRLTELQAAVGISQLQYLKRNNRMRQKHARIYEKKLAKSLLELPTVDSSVHHVYYKYPVLLPRNLANKRDRFVRAVLRENVLIESGYSNPLYAIDFIRKKTTRANCPITEDICRRIMNLQTAPCLTKQDILDTCDAVLKVCDSIEMI